MISGRYWFGGRTIRQYAMKGMQKDTYEGCLKMRLPRTIEGIRGITIDVYKRQWDGSGTHLVWWITYMIVIIVAVCVDKFVCSLWGNWCRLQMTALRALFEWMLLLRNGLSVSLRGCDKSCSYIRCRSVCSLLLTFSYRNVIIVAVDVAPVQRSGND